MKKNIKKTIALAVAINLLTPYSATYAEEITSEQAATQTLYERVQKILHPETEQPPSDPLPEEAETPEDVIPYPEKNTEEEEEALSSESTTIIDWEKNSIEICPPDLFCDGVTDNRTNWADIWGKLAILFGNYGNSDSGSATTPIDVNTLTTIDEGFTGGDYSVFSNVYPDGTADESWSDVPVGETGTGILGGIPLSENASYSWTRQGPGALKIQALVYPLNPEVDSATKFGALVTSTNPSVHVYPPSQYASETFTTGGIQTKTFRFLTVEYAKNSKPRTGYVIVRVNANIYEGSTSLCSVEDAGCNNGTEFGSEFDNPATATTTTNTGSTNIGGSTNGSGLDFSGIAGNWDKATSTYGKDDANNASNPDWMSDGFSNITNDGNSQDSSIPDGFGSQFADNQGTATIDRSTGAINTPNSGEYASVDQNPATAEISQNTGNYTESGGSESIETPANAEMSFGDYVKSGADSALSGIFNKIDSAIGNNPSASGSLTSKLASLTGSNNTNSKTAVMDANTRLPGSVRNGSSTADVQSMIDVATQMLTAYGRNPDDIKNGKLFDAGSAYTDPQDAWNLNRMSSAKAKAQVKANATPIVK